MQERELKIIEFLIKCARAEDKRPYWKRIADTFAHNLKVFKERLSPIK